MEFRDTLIELTELTELTSSLYLGVQQNALVFTLLSVSARKGRILGACYLHLELVRRGVYPRRGGQRTGARTPLIYHLVQDYYATEYSAEIVNTLTNLMFMWLGVQGIRSCRRNGHDQIFIVALIGYLVVGTGSFLFHSTLKCKCPYTPSQAQNVTAADIHQQCLEQYTSDCKDNADR